MDRMAATLSKGSTGFEVAPLPMQLNMKGKFSPPLDVDAFFGPKTRAAVGAFQTHSQLSANGIVGPKTRTAVAQGLTPTTANHAGRHLAQLTITTSWATSMAMAMNPSVVAVLVRTTADLVLLDGSLRNGSDDDTAIQPGREYGHCHNLRCHPRMS